MVIGNKSKRGGKGRGQGRPRGSTTLDRGHLHALLRQYEPPEVVVPITISPDGRFLVGDLVKYDRPGMTLKELAAKGTMGDAPAKDSPDWAISRIHKRITLAKREFAKWSQPVEDNLPMPDYPAKNWLADALASGEYQR